MTTHEEERELDQFWRDLSAEMISDTITLEEAGRRMAAAEDDELSDARIRNMVQRATTRRSSLKPAVEPLPRAPRGRIQSLGGWRLTANVAATGVVSAMLLSAGIAWMLWSEGQYSTTTLRFDTASRIVTDANETYERRKSALSNLTVGVIKAVDALNEIAAGGGELGKVAEQILLGLRLSVSSPADLEFVYTTVESIDPLVHGAKAGSDTQRYQKMREMERETTYALSSIYQSGVVDGPGNFGDWVRTTSLGSIRRMLGL